MVYFYFVDPLASIKKIAEVSNEITSLVIQNCREKCGIFRGNNVEEHMKRATSHVQRNGNVLYDLIINS